MPSEAADREAPGQARVADHYAYTSEDNLAREKEHADDYEESRTSSTPLPSETPGGAGQKEKEKEKEKQRPASKGPKPFEQSERDEMENLLNELRGHLGESSSVWYSFLTDKRCSNISYAILGRGGCCKQLLVPYRQVSSPLPSCRSGTDKFALGSCRCRSTTRDTPWEVVAHKYCLRLELRC